MRRVLSYLVLIAAFLLIPAGVLAQEILDKQTRTALGEKLDEYIRAIEREPAAVKCREADFLIESSEDSLIRQFIAIHLYSSYLNSKVMGDETVAVHITDNWFLKGRVHFRDELDLINAKVYADFTRSSLVGNKAPDLFPDTFGSRPAILYFYDTKCSRCKIESLVIKNLLENKDYPVDLIAFYTGDDQEAWTDYIKENLPSDDGTVNTRHQWDPDLATGFQKKYSVLSTPQIFLIDSDRTILGRSLDSYALAVLLKDLFDHSGMVYGGEDSAHFFDMLFSEETTDEDIKSVADRIYGKIGEGQRGVKAAKQTLGDLLLYLGTINKEEFRKGTSYLIDRYIKDNPIWNTPEDTLQIIDYADFLESVIHKPEYGSTLPKVRLELKIIRGGKEKTVRKRLDKAVAGSIVIFHTEGCPVCEKEIAAAKESGLKIVKVNIDKVLMTSPEMADRLFKSLDLSSLPFIIRTDSKGRVINKYISLIKG